MSQRKLKRKPKAGSQQIHAMRQFYSRFGRELTLKEYYTAIEDIQTNNAIFIEKKTNRISIFRVSCNNTPAIAVYDKLRKTIATFLTPKMIE